MKKIFLFILLSISLSSCSVKKTVVSSSRKKIPKVTNGKKYTLADKVVWTAVSFKGTPYKYGGMTKKGMDCSGLMYTSFKKRGVNIPRTSNELYEKGKNIKFHEIKRGDLVFFKTSKKRNRKINHVGLVTSSNNNIKFIHSSTSKGVIVSSLNSKYWKKAFVAAKRILK